MSEVWPDFCARHPDRPAIGIIEASGDHVCSACWAELPLNDKWREAYRASLRAAGMPAEQVATMSDELLNENITRMVRCANEAADNGSGTF